MSAVQHCSRMPAITGGWPVLIDGSTNRTSAYFLRTIGELLDFPQADNANWDAYLDWMRDLSWIPSRRISIVLLHFEYFLCEEPEMRRNFLEDLEKVIFPFWDKDAQVVFDDPGLVKDLQVYCVSGGMDDLGFLPSDQAFAAIRRNALEGVKVPHITSVPVLRMQEGTLYLAAFLTTYSREQLKNESVKRPGMWVLADLKDGTIQHRCICPEQDFSQAPYDTLYNISAGGLRKASAEYWKDVYGLMDLIRMAYLQNGCLPMELYAKYLDRILQTTPRDYRTFYKELNNIQREEQTMDEEKRMETVAETADPVQACAGVPEPAPEKPCGPEEEPTPAESAEEPAPAEPAVPDSPETAVPVQLMAQLESLQQAMAALQESFDTKIAQDEHKDKLFDNMHQELVRYQNGAVEKIVDTMALDIIQLVDSVRSSLRIYEKKEPTEESYKKLLRVVKGIIEDLQDILYRQDIEAYRVDGHAVDVRRQKIIQTLPTDDPAKDNLVAVRCADGYERRGKVFRPERIKIFKYTPAEPTSDK